MGPATGRAAGRVMAYLRPPMIHVVTAHHHSADWIELQRRYLDRFAGEPFQLWGSLEGVDESHHRHFDHVVPSLGGHAGKLNLLGRVVCDVADRDDLLVFLDGDAFPVAEMGPRLRALLADAPLAAVQRTENGGDTQPHPCFCATTVGLWADLPGDWSSGYVFRPGRTDVGANLMHRLERTGTPWTPILRTHSLAEHDVFFGVYGGFVYHHGAGFRRLKTSAGDRTPGGLTDRVERSPLEGIRGEHLRTNLGERGFKSLVEKAFANQALSEQVYAQIVADPDLFDRVLAEGGR